MTPWAYLFGGALLALQALSAAQLAKVFPSAGGWYTWIARALHPRAGFFAGVFFSVWLPPVGALTLSLLAKTVLEPSIKAEYSVTIHVVDLGDRRSGAGHLVGLRRASRSRRRLLIITGTIEIVIMVALAFSGLARPRTRRVQLRAAQPRQLRPGDATCSSGWCSRSSRSAAGNPPVRWPRRARTPSGTCPIGLVGSVIILMIYFVFVTWGYLVGFGVDKVGKHQLRHPRSRSRRSRSACGAAPGWFLLFALLNSAIAVSIACFNGGTRTWYAMGRSGVLPKRPGQGGADAEDAGQRDRPRDRRERPRVRLRPDLGRRQRVLHLGQHDHASR